MLNVNYFKTDKKLFISQLHILFLLISICNFLTRLEYAYRKSKIPVMKELCLKICLTLSKAQQYSYHILIFNKI